MLKGIDVSSYQGVINWDAVKSSVDFSIIKASEGCPDPGQSVAQYTDPQFKHNQSEARRVGISRGFYHFARPDYNDPEPEAQQLFNAIGGLEENEIAALDLEVFTVKSGIDIVEWALRWLTKWEELTGNKALIYMSASVTTAHDWSPVFNAGHGLWVADYGMNDGNVPAIDFKTGVWPTAAIWQYTSVGSTAGLKPVDMDNFYGDLAAFNAYGYHAPFVVDPAPPAPVITTSDATVTTPIPFDITSIEDATIPVGQQTIIQPGITGSHVIVTRTTFADGVATGTEVISDVTNPATNQIVSIGTQAIPTPPLPPDPTTPPVITTKPTDGSPAAMHTWFSLVINEIKKIIDEYEHL